MEGKKMKAKIRYLMVILFFVSLLVEQLGCAHTPRHPSKEMTVRSTRESEFNPPAEKGQGLRIAKGILGGQNGNLFWEDRQQLIRLRAAKEPSVRLQESSLSRTSEM
jgi:hypothetical protein